ncbi:MAG: hypothetical protein ACKOQ5_06445 [Solirubrobacterales bacterium]
MLDPKTSTKQPQEMEATTKPTLLERVGSVAARFGRKAPKRRWVRFLLGTVLTLLVFGFLFATVVSQWSEIEQAGISFEVLWLIPALAIMGVYFVLAGAAWGLILSKLDSPISQGKAQRTFAQPLLIRYIPGTVLFVLARILLTERAGVARRVATAAIVYEQAISVAAALSIAAWFLIAHPDLADYWTRWLPLAIVPMFLILLSPPVFGPVSKSLLGMLGREPLPQIMGMRSVIELFALFLMIWAVMGAGAYLAVRSVLAVGLDDAIIVVSSQAIGYLAAIASAVFPAGLGVKDAAFAWSVKVALPGESFAVGAALAIAVRAIQTVAELGYIGLVSLITKPLRESGEGTAPATPQAEPKRVSPG